MAETHHSPWHFMDPPQPLRVAHSEVKQPPQATRWVAEPLFQPKVPDAKVHSAT